VGKSHGRSTSAISKSILSPLEALTQYHPPQQQQRPTTRRTQFVFLVSTAQQSGNNYLLKKGKIGFNTSKKIISSLSFGQRRASQSSFGTNGRDRKKHGECTGSHHLALLNCGDGHFDCGDFQTGNWFVV
jgi:hypothetical protein